MKIRKIIVGTPREKTRFNLDEFLAEREIIVNTAIDKFERMSKLIIKKEQLDKFEEIQGDLIDKLLSDEIVSQMSDKPQDIFYQHRRVIASIRHINEITAAVCEHLWIQEN